MRSKRFLDPAKQHPLWTKYCVLGRGWWSFELEGLTFKKTVDPIEYGSVVVDIRAYTAKRRARIGSVFAVIAGLPPLVPIFSVVICMFRGLCKLNNNFVMLLIFSIFAVIAFWCAISARSVALLVASGQHDDARNRANKIVSFLQIPLALVVALSVLTGIGGLSGLMTHDIFSGIALMMAGFLATYWIPLGLAMIMLNASAAALEPSEGLRSGIGSLDQRATTPFSESEPSEEL